MGMTEQSALLGEKNRSKGIAQYREKSEYHQSASAFLPCVVKVGAALSTLAIVLLWEFTNISLLITQARLPTWLPLTEMQTWHQQLPFGLLHSAGGQCKSSAHNNDQP